MSSSNKPAGLLRFGIKNYFKKNGFNILRYVFNATERASGQECTFFIELATLNPYLSPSEVVLGFKPRIKISEDDIHNVAAGSESAKNLQSEILVVPSYTVVRAGVYGQKAKQICHYDIIKNFYSSQKTFDIETSSCHFTDEKLIGQLVCSEEDLIEHPEFLCNKGSIMWDLHYEKQFAFPHGFKSKTENWSIPGAKAVFAGNITIDGNEFVVTPKKSFGYIEHIWKKSSPTEWIHISSSNLTSIFTGKLMQDSCFTVHGEYDGRLSVLLNMENSQVTFNADSSKRSYNTIWECVQAPNEKGGEKLHWSVSLNSKSYVIDVDVFCPISQLFVRSLEMPEGGRNLLKLLCGATGAGEIRLYKKLHKNLELIENARIAGAFCEFGKVEETES